MINQGGIMTSSLSASNATLPSLVSVVIPCYNSARYLAETIESVRLQTYPRIEIIVVDDGSTDETASIVRSCGVRYIYQTNRGISAARNAGILHSQGKYVLFLDHDDRLLPRAVETGVKLLEEHPDCTLAVGEHRYIGPDGAAIGYSNKCAVGRDHYQMLLESNFVETPCSVLHRRSGLAQTGVFDESLLGAEDHELYLRTARQGNWVAHEAPVAEYRLHESSTSRNAERMLEVSYRVLEMELPFVEGDREKLRAHRRGVKFVERHYGRRLTRELLGTNLTTPENRRKLKLLRRHYRLGFAAVLVSRFLPPKLLNLLLASRALYAQWGEQARRAQRRESLSLG
jgi:glycosyltransferase involved in cell wall biosynthesis